MTREVMEQALEALHYGKANKAVTILREALEQPVQPVQPERKPLTDEMRKQMLEASDNYEMRGAFANGWLSAEAAHNIKEET
jgi:hypothetical protein